MVAIEKNNALLALIDLFVTPPERQPDLTVGPDRKPHESRAIHYEVVSVFDGA